MKCYGKDRNRLFLKTISLGVTLMIVISSVAIASVTLASGISETPEDTTQFEYPTQPCNVRSVLTETGTWVSFDSSSPGTLAEAHVTISDTSGITIVADFYGFWRNNYTINETIYDDLEMPGATITRLTGAPMLPCLYEYVEIPHNIDISIEVIASSKANISGFNIRPAPAPTIPYSLGESALINESQSIDPQIILDSVYSNNATFPGVTTSTEGELSLKYNGEEISSMIMRGHRIMGLSFYPVQYNPVTSEVEIYSQLIVKVNYDTPAQILPVRKQLRSNVFDVLLFNNILNYDSINTYPATGVGAATTDTLPPGFERGAEYLIITNETFEFQANRLANWKEQKGVSSRVEIVYEDPVTHEVSTQDVIDILDKAYEYWYPVPTYVLLMGDVEVIPANYDYQHGAGGPWSAVFQNSYNLWGQGNGHIASDLGYFNREGGGYIPDMIYSRISVDTVEQARIIVDKILQYEQNPPDGASFYNNILSAGYFQDINLRDEVEDSQCSFIYTLERIRHYLKDTYNVHVNYSIGIDYYNHGDTGWLSPLVDQANPIDLVNLKFRQALDLDETTSQLLMDSLADVENFGWIGSHYVPPRHRDHGRGNITNNINDGRFLVLFIGHGGSKNMKHPTYMECSTNNRDLEEGWNAPYFNTSFFSDLTNGDMVPLFINLACNTGWYDGETDEQVLDLDYSDGVYMPTNPFTEYDNECFAENITRLEGGGAIAAISASRPAYASMITHMADAFVQAFWPGLLNPDIQPMYGMGTALLYSKLYAKTNWVEDLGCIISDYAEECRVIQTTFEEFHLFGDPETELWTDVPSYFNVSYPRSVGTTDPQRFVVTVKNSDTGLLLPVSFAKVCIQQEDDILDTDDIYQVGYTNARGQVIFDIAPLADPSHVNVTVTKHNFRPHIGNMPVYDSIARLSLSDYSILETEILTISLVDFPDDDTYSFFADEYLLSQGLPSGTTEYHWDLDGLGPNRYINVWAGEYDLARRTWSAVSVDRFAIISTEDGPDPWIYSHNDPTTWDDPTDEILWDNPDIIIYRVITEGISTEVSSMTQNAVHNIDVIVHNSGSDSILPTTVTLSYASFGGGLSWKEIGEYEVFPDHEGTDIAHFTISPSVPHSVCLRVDLFHTLELPENEINNIGLENVGVIEMGSPGERSFLVGNPKDLTDYIFINVKQQGNYEDVWNATILDYSSQAMGVNLNETIRLFVDPLVKIESDEWRIFTVEIYVNSEMIGGMVFNATLVAPEPDIFTWLLIIGGASAIIAAVIYTKQRK